MNCEEISLSSFEGPPVGGCKVAQHEQKTKLGIILNASTKKKKRIIFQRLFFSFRGQRRLARHPIKIFWLPYATRISKSRLCPPIGASRAREQFSSFRSAAHLNKVIEISIKALYCTIYSHKINRKERKVGVVHRSAFVCESYEISLFTAREWHRHWHRDRKGWEKGWAVIIKSFWRRVRVAICRGVICGYRRLVLGMRKCWKWLLISEEKDRN